MQRPLLRKIQPKNQLESQVNEFKLQRLAEDIVDFKKDTETKLDSAIEKVNTVADDAKDTLTELKTLPKKVQKDFEELTNEVVDALKEIKAGGLKGDPGESPDEEAIEKRLLAKIPEVNIEKIAEKASALVKPTPASLKVIKESVELKDEEIVPKLNKATNLGDLNLSIKNIKDWDAKWGDIKAEISRNKGGYHGGGFNNIASASATVSTGLDTLKFTGSGVSSVTQTGRTVTVDIAGGGGSGTVTNIATAGLISGGPITTTGTITTSMATGKLVGRSTAGTGVMEEITVGSGLTLSGGTLTATGGGTGDVVGPASATDTAVALFDGTTGKLIKNSTVTINTIGQASGLNRLTATTNFSLQTGTTTSANGYNIALTAGSVASGNGDGGNVILTPGLKSGTGTNGYIKMFGSSGLFSANFTAGSLTADRVITLPDAAGTLTFGTGTTNQLTYWVDANTVGALTTATYPSLTELSYVKGVTSSIQTQLNAKGAGTVTSVSFTGGLISVATATTTPAFTVAGTSGGVPYFSSASTWATSAALAANAIVIGGGAGAAPATTTTGTGVLTALGINVGTAGAFVVNGGALGTPSSGTVTNLTGTASININGTVGATTPTTGSFTTVTASTSTTSPIIIGGTGTTSTLTLQPTSGVGTTGADIVFKVGNNGATEAGRVLNAATFQWGGIASASRVLTIDNLGRTIQRYDDNSLQYLTTLSNRAITAANQGAGILWQLADTGAAGVNAGSISVLSENTTFAGATADSRMVFATTLDGSLTNRMWLTSAGGLSLGSATNTNSTVRLTKLITGGTSAYGVFQDGVVQSDVTTDVAYNRTVLSTAAAAFTVTTAYHYNATQSTIGAGSAVTTQIGYNAESSLTGATNNYGFYGNIASGTGRYNLYMNGTAQNYLAGNTGIGGTPFTDTSLRVGGAPGTATILYGIYLNTAIPATTTGAYDSNISIPSVAASAFTLGTLRHFRATQGTIGAGATVTNQFGFFADSSLTGATNNYGFYGNIASGTGRWNLYMNGTAANFFAGTLTVPQVYNTDVAATVAANAATITRASRNNTFTNSSAAAMTITLSTTGAAGGDMLLVQVYDFSAVAQTITWVNTENSTVTAPVTSNGSTTLPLTVGFKWNASTSKWRCIASA